MEYMKSNIYRLTVDQFERLSISAVKYACGRCTYMPSVIIRIIATYSYFLSDKTKQEIIDYVSTREKELGKHALGMDFDAKEWNRFIYRLEKDMYPKIDIFDPDLLDFWLLVGSSLRFNFSQETPNIPIQEYESIIEDNDETFSLGQAAVFTRDLAEVISMDIQNDAPIFSPFGDNGYYADKEGYKGLYRCVKSKYLDLLAKSKHRYFIDKSIILDI